MVWLLYQGEQKIEFVLIFPPESSELDTEISTNWAPMCANLR